VAGPGGCRARAVRINFSAIAGPVGALGRRALGLVPRGTTVRIIQGRLRGARWVVGAGTHGCWLGSYEQAKQILMETLVQPGGVAYDIGANAGFFTLLFSRLVGESGSVVAFEPLPANLRFLRQHLAKNDVRNVATCA
jgi:hypothetical protein